MSTAGAPLTEGLRPLDAHLHVWDLSVCDYPWLGPEHGELYATFGPEKAAAELAGSGVGGAVLVQAEDSAAETDYLLAVADDHPWVAGVVGWLPLTDPAAAARALHERARQPAFVGVRHLVHDDPRADFLDRAEVRESLKRLVEHGHPFDVPDAWPRHLTQTRKLAADLPELTVVIDHLAKPPIGTPEMPAWQAEMARVAHLPNTVAKFSGLRMPGVDFTPTTLRPVWEIALELFGPDRLMYGGDWPITVPGGGYGPTYEVMTALVAELSPEEQTAVMRRTAERVYHLPSAEQGTP